jgi:hypothetical protein
MKQILVGLMGEINNSTIIVGDFNPTLSRMTRQKVSKEKSLNHLD